MLFEAHCMQKQHDLRKHAVLLGECPEIDVYGRDRLCRVEWEEVQEMLPLLSSGQQ